MRLISHYIFDIRGKKYRLVGVVKFTIGRIFVRLTDETPAHDKNALELAIVSDVVEEYEKIHYPIAKPTIGDLITLSIEERGMTQRQLASEIG